MKMVLIIAAIGAVLIIVAGMVAYNNDMKWEAFKTSHECKAVAKLPGEVFNTVGVSPGGGVAIGIGATADRVGWLCNDGVTYYR